MATDVGDNAILLDQGRAGYLIPPASPEKLAAAISELLSRPKNRDELAQAALRQAQGFDFRRTVQAHERYYAALADAPWPFLRKPYSQTELVSILDDALAPAATPKPVSPRKRTVKA